MANRSLNQFRRELEAFARTHGQLQTVQFNKQNDLLDGGDVNYWAFYYTLNRARKEGGYMAMYFTGWVADVMHKEKENEAEIWSDAILIATDLLAFMDGDDREYRLDDGVELRNFTEATGDLLAGVTFDFVIRSPFAYNGCLIPETGEGVNYLLTDDGRYILTDDGRKIIVEQATGILLLADSGQPLLTDDGRNLILG